ncbi:MAG: metallophosphoesterase family protein [Candidatus Omnitrophica bacterium]|nr:metallophosphoesterase family protein [Candidatus Omnitrophota bacterium]
MIRIGVVADTHSRPIPKPLIKDFKSVDLIIHAGDFCSLEDVKTFEKLGQLKAVFGNMDERGVTNKFPAKDIIQVEDVFIGVIHGEGPPKTVLDSVVKAFKKDKVHAVIFGHSHVPTKEMIGKTLFFNPGSPNDLITAPYCSYGMITIDKSVIDAKIIRIKT